MHSSPESSDAPQLRGLVFSRDRALQLDACLTSMLRCAGEQLPLTLRVLFRATTPRHARQYHELAEAFRKTTEFVEEQSFRAQVLSALGTEDQRDSSHKKARLRPLIAQKPETEPNGDGGSCVMFLVDDAVFVRALKLSRLQTALWLDPTTIGVSLRLGKNTGFNYVLNRRQLLPDFEDGGEGLLKFRWTHGDGDFGYPLEVSSSIYRLSMMQELIGSIEFSDPNTLESGLSLAARKFRRSHPYLLCSEISTTFSIPLNRVQNVYSNRAGADPRRSTEALADRFDAGERFDVAALNGFVPPSCHAEVELSFVRRGAPDASG